MIIINEKILSDVFYKLYLHLPYVKDAKYGYKEAFRDFMSKYGFRNTSAKLLYIFSGKENQEQYANDAKDFFIDVNSLGEDKNLEKKVGQEIFYSALFKFIASKQKQLYNAKGAVEDEVNIYWRDNAQQLIFLIAKWNNISSVSMSNMFQKSMSEFNDNALRFINELIQNADDCVYEGNINAFRMVFNRVSDEIEISYPEKGFTYADVISLSSVDETNKMGDVQKATTTIGEKGKGFKSLFKYFKEVEIVSGGYHFRFNIETSDMTVPIFVDGREQEKGTSLRLRLKDEIGFFDENERKKKSSIDNLILDVKSLYGNDNAGMLYRNNSIMFTRHFTDLQIIFKDRDKSELIRVANTHILSDGRKGDVWWDGKVNERFNKCSGSMRYYHAQNIKNNEIESYFEQNKLKLKYTIKLIGLVHYPQYTRELLEKRYGKIDCDYISIVSLKMPIVMFGIDELIYEDILEKKECVSIGHMYTYLPTSMNISIPFIFQVPFNLEDNRSGPKEHSTWNDFLLTAIWGTENSNNLISHWYQVLIDEKGIECIYDYLPGSNMNKAKEIAEYETYKYHFDPLGGSKYEDNARGNIRRFNIKVKDDVLNTFKELNIIPTISGEKVSIQRVILVDNLIEAFDISGVNLLWEAYEYKQTKSRGVDTIGTHHSDRILEFASYLDIDKKNIILRMKNLAGKKEHIFMAKELNRYYIEDVEYVNTFTKIFLQAWIWEKYFSKELSELSSDEKEILINWADGLVWLSINYNSSSVESIRYWYDPEETEFDNGKISGGKRILWLLNTEKNKIFSQCLSRKLVIAVIDKCTYGDNKLLDILIENKICSLEDVFRNIDSWDEIPNYYKIMFMTRYYIDYSLNGSSTSVYVDFLSGCFKNFDDYSIIDRLFQEEYGDDTEKRLLFENIKFNGWDSNDRKKTYPIVFEFLTDEIIEAINPRNADGLVSVEDKGIEFKTYPTGDRIDDEQMHICPDGIRQKYTNILVNQRYFSFVKKYNFIKFQEQEVILLKAEESLSDVIESEIKLPIQVYKNIVKIREAIEQNQYRAMYGMDYHLSVIKAIQSYQIASLVNDDNFREPFADLKTVFNELLQNINDYIEPQSNVVIALGINEDGKKVFRLWYTEQVHEEKIKNQQIKRRGFTQKDILSLLSVGKSAKKDDADKNIGSKGIGFKNVYSVFSRVWVDSNGFRFYLNDENNISARLLFDELETRIKAIETDKECIVENVLNSFTESYENIYEEEEDEKSKFPIIQKGKALSKTELFKYSMSLPDYQKEQELKDVDITAFEFQFIEDDDTFNSFMSQLLGTHVDKVIENTQYYINKVESSEIKKLRKNSYQYRIVYLHNCADIVFVDSNEKSYSWKRAILPALELNEWHNSEYFYSQRRFIEGIPFIEDKSRRYERLKNSEREGILADFEVSFMKTPVILSDNKRPLLFNDGLLYVALPTELLTGGAVHINMPGLSTTLDRTSIYGFEFENQSKEAKWNRELQEKAFGEEGLFVKIFNEFVEIHQKEIFNYAFLYIPTKIYSLNGNYISQGIKQLNCIPCMTKDGVVMRSAEYIKDHARNVHTLKNYMSVWMELFDPDYKLFYDESVCGDTAVEFIYMRDPEGWGLEEYFEESKFNLIRPNVDDYEDDSFVGYVVHYWQKAYESLDSTLRKKVDETFQNRFIILSSHLGIENAYEKWVFWKKELANSFRESKAIEHLSDIVCFDVDSYDNYFYFTKKDVLERCELEKVAIPDSTMKVYSRSLKERGLKDFLRYKSLLEMEICYLDEKCSEETGIVLADKMELSIWGYSGKNELMISTFDYSLDRIMDYCINQGLKLLDDVLDLLPILLYSDKFVEKESNELIVNLPGNLFEDNSIILKNIPDYKNLIEGWIEKDLVVSRVNVADSSEIHSLSSVKPSLMHLLMPVYENWLDYLSMLKCHPAIVGQDIINNFIEYILKKYYKTSEDQYGSYFEVILSAMQIYLQKLDSNDDWGINLKYSGIDFDMATFAYGNNVALCNEVIRKIEEEEQCLAVYVYEENCSDDRYYYWEEISPLLTENDRSKIASFYLGEVKTQQDVEKGIDKFLSRIFLCKESPALYKEYPYNQYLLADYEEDNNRVYFLFEDYVESLTVLLKDLFDIKIGKQKIHPLYNLDKYNSRYPFGNNDDLHYAEIIIVHELDRLNNEINAEIDEKKKKRLISQYYYFITTLLAQQFCVGAGKYIKGYGRTCPFLGTDSVLEMQSLQVISIPIFGLHIGVPIFGSSEAVKFLTKYNSKSTVSFVKKRNSSKRRRKDTTDDLIISYSAGKYMVSDSCWSLSARESLVNGELVHNTIERIIDALYDITNEFLVEIESYTIDGVKKTFSKRIELTIPHRIVMIYELRKYL